MTDRIAIAHAYEKALFAGRMDEVAGYFPAGGAPVAGSVGTGSLIVCVGDSPGPLPPATLGAMRAPRGDDRIALRSVSAACF